MRTIHTPSPTRRLLLRYFHAYKQVLFYGTLFLVGVLAGALFLKNSSPQMTQSLAKVVGSFAKSRAEQELAATFFASFSSTALLLAVLFICGFCAVAQPVIVLLPLFRGLGFGYQAGYLYAQNGFAGVGYVALVLLPNMVLSTLLLIWGCGEAFRMSTAYYFAAKQESGRGTLINLRLYCGKFALLLCGVLVSSMLDTAFNFLFGRLFTLV